MGGEQKNGLPRCGARPGRNPGPDLGGSNGGHGSQTSAPLHKMSERVSSFGHGGQRGSFCSIKRADRCLLDEIGKLLERVVVARLERHKSGQVPSWHESQYGFRKGRSTINAIRRVRTLTEDMVFVKHRQSVQPYRGTR